MLNGKLVVELWSINYVKQTIVKIAIILRKKLKYFI